MVFAVTNNYDFDIVHKPVRENIADCLSRIINENNSTVTNESDEFVCFVTVNAIPDSITLNEVRKAS